MTAAQQIEEKFASDEFTYKTAREIGGFWASRKRASVRR